MSTGGEELFSCSRMQVRTLSISIVQSGVQVPGQVTQTHKGNCSSLTVFPCSPCAFYHVFVSCRELRTGTCYMPIYPVTVLSSREGARLSILSEDLLPEVSSHHITLHPYLLAVELQADLKARGFVVV